MEEKKKNGQLEEMDEALTEEAMDSVTGGGGDPVQLTPPSVEIHNYPTWDDPTSTPREIQPPQ